MEAKPLPDEEKALSEKAAPVRSIAKGISNEQAVSIVGQAQSALADQSRPEANSFTVVAIGASAGGLEAITRLLQNLSANTGMAFIYVQHLSPDHKSILSSLLQRITEMNVQDIQDMDKIEPNNVYVIPYNKEIEVADGHIKLTPRLANKTSNLSIDLLFTSLAETYKENVIGIVLSGAASDGTRGLKEIKSAGGTTFAQDSSAKFGSMPESAIAEGVVDFVLSPEEIAKKLEWISQHPAVKMQSIKTAQEDKIENNDPYLRTIFQVLHSKKNVDFSHYKMNTIKRRMLRRMLITKIKTIKQYAEFVAQNNSEAELLYQDLLINVTSFFRDPEAFLVLENSVFPRILASKTLGETLRIWVAACATGEEVYSIAMLLLESQRHKPGSIPFQIFATDLSEEAISKARLGEYSAQQLKNVSPRRIQQFFVKAKDKYRISKTLRDICVFARHNILNDPPFSRMDFISCRNFLIYLDAPAQKKAISTFNYALNAGGCLMLGKAETIGASAQLFTALDKKFKIYSRKNNSGPFKLPVISSRISFTTMPEANSLSTPGPKKLPAASNNTLGSAFDSILLAQYMPASVIINYDFEILQFRGSTAPYLQHSPGRASFNILKMAQAEITFELRNAIHHAIKTKQTICKTGIEMNRDFAANTRQIVNLEVTPLDIEGEEPLLIVVFSGHQVEMAEQSDSSKQNNSLAKDRRIKKLEEEIDAARSDMGSITHDQEAANEELQSANEEIVSSNEELQSLNEELETSKEEIESTNEELTTSNQELIARIQQVEELYAYYEAILATIHEPMVILDKNIQIKSANQAFCKMFHVTEGECLGISLYKLGNNQWNIQKLRELIEEIVPQNHRFHNFEVEHTFPVIGHKTMLLNAHRINQPGKNEELIVLTISDITEVKRLAVELQEKEKKALLKQLELEKKAIKVVEDSNKRYNMLLLQSPFAIAILKGKDMVITLANDSIVEMWGKGKDLIGKPLLEVLPELKENQFPHLLDDVYTTGMPFYGNELMATLYRNGEPTDAYFNFVYQPYREADESILGVTVISYDVTAQVMAKNELIEAKNKAEQATQIAEIAVKAKQQFLSNMSHEIRTPMNAIIGFTNVVLKTPLDESQKEYLNAIKVSGEALIVLINDILDLARVDSGKMSFEKIPFNLSASVATMLQLFGTKIKEKNLKLTEEYDQTIPAFLIGDPMRLRQIVINLLSNAVKFTEEGEISLRVRMLNETPEKATVEFALTDTGIGISEDKLGLIFNNFEQAAPGTGNIYGGSGLGLAIVKQFVELQGGSTFVHSQVGKGSTFGFVLDFEKTNPDTGIKTGPLVEMDFQSPLPETVLQDVKILVVEDIALNQLLIKIILLDFGFDVSVAANGKIAIENLKKDPFDIVLMDLHMPEMDGFEATDYIRHQMNSTIPIIALTADVTTLDNEKCLAVGMNDYISKPIDETLLYSKIIQCLKKSDPKKYLA